MAKKVEATNILVSFAIVLSLSIIVLSFPFTVYAVTDNPIGKFVANIDGSNETLHLKIIGTIDKDEVKANKEIQFSIIGPDGIKKPNSFMNKEISMNSFGSFNGIINLIGDWDPGTYKIDGEYTWENIGSDDFTIFSSTSQDSDKDQISDYVDSCPERSETYNKFQDDDDCSDFVNGYNEIPDADSDEREDKNDVCVDGSENYNGYRNLDGCPEASGVISNELIDYDDIGKEDKTISNYSNNEIIKNTNNFYVQPEESISKITFNFYVENNVKSHNDILKTTVSESVEYWAEKIPIIAFKEVADIDQSDFFIRGSFDTNEKIFALVDNKSKFKKPFVEINLKKINKDLKRDSPDSKILKKILIHELGHMIGFSHSEDPNDVMFPSLNSDSGNNIVLELSDNEKSDFRPIITREKLTNIMAVPLSEEKLSILQDKDILKQLPDEMFEDVLIKMADYSLEEKQILVNIYKHIIKQQSFEGSSNDSILFWLFGIFMHINSQLDTEIEDIQYEINEAASNEAFKNRFTEFLKLELHLHDNYERLTWEIHDKFQNERMILENTTSLTQESEIVSPNNFSEYFLILKKSIKPFDNSTFATQSLDMQKLQEQINTIVREIDFDQEILRNTIFSWLHEDQNENKNKLRLQEMNRYLDEIDNKLLILKKYENRLYDASGLDTSNPTEHMDTQFLDTLENIFKEREAILEELNIQPTSIRIPTNAEALKLVEIEVLQKTEKISKLEEEISEYFRESKTKKIEIIKQLKPYEDLTHPKYFIYSYDKKYVKYSDYFTYSYDKDDTKLHVIISPTCAQYHHIPRSSPTHCTSESLFLNFFSDKFDSCATSSCKGEIQEYFSMDNNLKNQIDELIELEYKLEQSYIDRQVMEYELSRLYEDVEENYDLDYPDYSPLYELEQLEYEIYFELAAELKNPMLKVLTDKNYNLKKELDRFDGYYGTTAEKYSLYFKHENIKLQINTNYELMYVIAKQQILEDEFSRTIANISNLTELINYTLEGFLNSNPDIKKFVYELLPKYKMQESFLSNSLDL